MEIISIVGKSASGKTYLSGRICRSNQYDRVLYIGTPGEILSHTCKGIKIDNYWSESIINSSRLVSMFDTYDCIILEKHCVDLNPGYVRMMVDRNKCLIVEISHHMDYLESRSYDSVLTISDGITSVESRQDKYSELSNINLNMIIKREIAINIIKDL